MASTSTRRGGHSNPCPICAVVFYTHPQLRAHISKQHICTRCSRLVENRMTHICATLRGGGSEHPEDTTRVYDPAFVQVQSSLLGVFKRYKFVKSSSTILIGDYYKSIYLQLRNFISKVINAHNGIKIRLVLDISMVKYRPNEDGTSWIEEPNYLNSNTYLFLNDFDIKPNLYDIVTDHIDHLNTMSQKGSGWTISKIDALNVYTSYPRFVRTGKWLPTPPCFKNRKGLINIKAPSNKCFKYAAICKFIGHKSARNGCPMWQYNYFEKLNKNNDYINFSGCNKRKGVTLGEIDQFEKNNPAWSVNVYKCNQRTGNIFPERATRRPGAQIKLDLLRIVKGDIQHVVLISSLSAFLGAHGSSKKYVCRGCFTTFKDKTKRDEHSLDCLKNFSQVIKFPKQQYKNCANIRWYEPCPMMVIADFETLRQLDGEVDNSCQLTEELLQPFSYQYVVYSGTSAELFKCYTGLDAHQQFINEMLHLADLYLERVSVYSKVMAMTRDDHWDFELAQVCCICRKHFNVEDEYDDTDVQHVESRNWEKRKVRHHSHGMNVNVFHELPRYTGAAHNSCNRNLRYRKQFPVLFHNLKSFDSKLILQGAAQIGIEALKVLARSCEKFLSITLNGQIVCIDTLAHLPRSLDSLIHDLREDGIDKFSVTRQIFRDTFAILDCQMDLLIGKLAFPYDNVTVENVDVEIAELPPKEYFFNSLTNKEVEDEAYENAQLVFKVFKCKSRRDYIAVYGLLDVTLLCDVWVSYRNVCLDVFKVDPTNFVSLPSMSFRVGLKMGAPVLEYIRDMDLLLLTLKAKIGGIVDVVKRYARSNIPGLVGYKPELPIKYILQMDINGLYSHIMRRYKLPTKGFRQLSQDEIDNFSIMDQDEFASHGFLFEVDIAYDGFKIIKGQKVHIHDYLRFLPPFPEKLEVNADMLNPTFRQFYSNNPQLPNNVGKQIVSCNLYPKKKYGVFLPMLKQGIRLGARVTKIHQIYTFEQEAFMHPFVDWNCEKRKVAKSTGESQARKFSCNSCYGMFGVDVTQFLHIVPVTHIDAARKLISKPTFRSFRVINESLALVEMRRESVVMNNHNMVAAAVLDLSKSYFYKVLYAFLDHFWGSIELDYVDTDSACFEIELDTPTKNIWEEVTKVKLDGEQLMDMSFLEPSNPFHSVEFKGETGKVQDDNYKDSNYKGVHIRKAYFVRKKAYGLLFHKGGTKMKLRGVQGCFLHKKDILSYRNAIFKKTHKYTKIKSIQSKRLQLKMVQNEKLSFNPVFSDNRRLIGKYGVTTLPFGHYKLCIKK